MSTAVSGQGAPPEDQAQVAAALTAGVAGPAAYSITTLSTAHTGSIVTAGPRITGGPGAMRAGLAAADDPVERGKLFAATDADAAFAWGHAKPAARRPAGQRVDVQAWVLMAQQVPQINRPQHRLD